MNTIEYYFHRVSAVHILLEEDGCSASRSTGSGANHEKVFLLEARASLVLGEWQGTAQNLIPNSTANASPPGAALSPWRAFLDISQVDTLTLWRNNRLHCSEFSETMKLRSKRNQNQNLCDNWPRKKSDSTKTFPWQPQVVQQSGFHVVMFSWRRLQLFWCQRQNLTWRPIGVLQKIVQRILWGRHKSWRRHQCENCKNHFTIDIIVLCV